MELKVKILDGEYFWGGDVNSGYDMPVCKDSEYNRDFRYSAHNQFMPFFISSKGRYIWSETGFKVWIDNGYLCFEGDSEFELFEDGACLRDAYLNAMNKHFPFEETRKQGKRLPREFFKSAQFNCWTEFDYEPTQEKILDYAHGIIDNGFEPGILMIDEGWHTRYGQWKFDLHKFPEPKKMIDELHSLGFIVMLWITPYVTCDGPDFAKDIRDIFSPDTYDKQFLRTKEGNVAIVSWWNGYSAILDLRKECDRKYLTDKLDFLMNEYGVDGFKCDGGNYDSYAKSNILNGTPADDHDQLALNQAWNEFGARFKFHEYKDTYKGGGKPVVQRLCDRDHSWTTSGIKSLVPCSILQGLFGHPFICPDMIGGGSWTDKYLPDFKIDEELFIRMAQSSCLFPMMQFSLMPWKHLSKESFDIVFDAYKLHIAFAERIVKEVEKAEKTGEPILRNLEYNCPNNGYATVTDEFMIGEDILVCPVSDKGVRQKEIVFPCGTWVDPDGNTYCGNSKIMLETPLEKLLWFERKC